LKSSSGQTPAGTAHIPILGVKHRGSGEIKEGLDKCPDKQAKIVI